MNEGVDPVTKAFPAEVGEVIEIVLQNEGSDSGGVEGHPWHAHGGHFWDLGRYIFAPIPSSFHFLSSGLFVGAT